MQIISGAVPRARALARANRELSRAARRRLWWMDYYRLHRNAARTCRYFGISRQTFYRWKRRYEPHDLSTLEDHSHRPHRRRQPTWTPQLAERVLRLRYLYPRWGKDKLAVLLRREGCPVSTSMVGRILTYLKQHGRLHEPPRLTASHRRARPRRPRPYAVRKPASYLARAPGDLVQVDTLELRPLPGVVLKQFTARDVVSRWDVVELYPRATAATAVAFLDSLLQRMPVAIRALQVDGGSEFAALFEQACRERGLRLFVLPPRSPKLNGSVERAQRTHTEEFYEVTPGSFRLPALNQQLRQWERVYNTVRPHQALGYLTPQQFLTQWQSQRKEARCH